MSKSVDDADDGMPEWDSIEFAEQYGYGATTSQDMPMNQGDGPQGDRGRGRRDSHRESPFGGGSHSRSHWRRPGPYRSRTGQRSSLGVIPGPPGRTPGARPPRAPGVVTGTEARQAAPGGHPPQGAQPFRGVIRRYRIASMTLTRTADVASISPATASTATASAVPTRAVLNGTGACPGSPRARARPGSCGDTTISPSTDCAGGSPSS